MSREGPCVLASVFFVASVASSLTLEPGPAIERASWSGLVVSRLPVSSRHSRLHVPGQVLFV